MYTFSRGLLAVCLLTGLSSCGALDILGGEERAWHGPPIRTDSTVYHVKTGEVAHEVTIGMTYRNGTDGPVYVAGCRGVYPPVLQQLQDGEWVTAYAPVILLCLGEPAVIEAGDEYTYSYHVYAPHLPNTGSQFEVDEIEGTYRLDWFALYASGRTMTPDERLSNTFRITR